ncbi:hypothetical protein AB0B66_43385 [Catellatospora sp. NPDC049111]|uniref:hypothetical protein n=1 Tax=Catellatospora sp. NPDC049111 TaxID=3155271 RepID=UPI0033E5787C
MNVRPPGGVGEVDGDGGALGDGDGLLLGDGEGDGPGPVLTAVFQIVYARPSALRLSAVALMLLVVSQDWW